MIVIHQNLFFADTDNLKKFIRQVEAMIKFLDEEVEYESIIIMAVQDAAEGLYFSDTDVAFMESLGAGGDDCPIRISLYLYLLYTILLHICILFYFISIYTFFLY